MTKGRPKVSIVCAWYERADYIRQTMDSLLHQDFHDYEIVVVNDGSPDPKVKEELERYDDPRLKVIHQRNLGFVNAIKRAVAESSGEYIAVQGAGDISLPDRIRKQSEVLDNNENVVAVGCYYLKKSLASSKIVKVKPPTVTKIVNRGIPVLHFSHGEMMFRRSAYEVAGGYREFFKVGQATDLWLRLLVLGDIDVVDEVLYQQHIFPDGVSLNLDKLLRRRLLHAFMLDVIGEKQLTGVDIIDKYGVHAPLFSAYKKHTSKQYLVSYLYAVAFGLPEVEALRLAGYRNSSGMYKLSLLAVKYIPWKKDLFKRMLANTQGYKKLLSDIRLGT